ncbi:glycosyltransferase [Sphingomonadaceae bacterium G21617-S1]|nr:glycosyltransferase [Sphingomonadaceae bacterium G21617-S1]
MIRVAHLLPTLEVGGRERTVIDLARAGPASGVEPVIVTHQTPLPGRHLLDASGIARAHIDAAGQLPALLRARRIDLLHVHGHVSAIQAGNVALPTVATLHVALGTGWRWAWPIRRALRRMDALVAVSDDLARRFGRLAGRRPLTIATGVDLARFPAVPIMDREVLTIGMIGRLHPVKRQRDAIEAVDRLRRRGIAVRLVIAGDGPLEPELRARAATMPDSVVLAGAVDDVPALLAGFDIFLLCSAHEGMPVALLEAMAAGLPCIATAVGGIPALADSEGVTLIPARRPAAIERAILDMADQVKRARAGAANRRAAAGYAIDRQARAYARLYQQVLTNPRAHDRLDDEGERT